MSSQPANLSGINAQMTLREWVMLLCLSLLWGGSFFVVEIALRELPPFTIVWLRVSLAAVALWSYALLTGRCQRFSPRLMLMFLLLGLLNNAIPFSLIVWAQSYITSGLAAIINATAPLFGVIVAAMLLPDEKISLLKLIGVAFGIAGVSFLIGPSALSGLGEQLLAQCASLGAALSYALAAVYARRFKKENLPPSMIAAGQATAAGILLLPVVLWYDQPWQSSPPGMQTWLAIAAYAIPCTAVAYILYFRILSSAGATNILLVTFLAPISAIILGAMFLEEQILWIHWLGMGLIGIGLSFIDGRLWQQG